MSPALTYFRVATIIGPGCLTSEFGMVSGIASRVWAPSKMLGMRMSGVRERRVQRRIQGEDEVKPIDWLVPVG